MRFALLVVMAATCAPTQADVVSPGAAESNPAPSAAPLPHGAEDPGAPLDPEVATRQSGDDAAAGGTAAVTEAPCPAPDHGPHCMWMTTRPPNAFRASHVAKKLTKQGFTAFGDGDRIIVHASDDQLRTLLGTDIRHERRERSSGTGSRCLAVVGPEARLHQSIRGEVSEFILDDPTCEM